ncbi:MAG: DNA-protecting protein DprA [Cyanobacteria bacterium SZAS LIN-3]|nr:DNA-protecting protein DprA [Cyanobacteria bacterium SZAS LIN-3]
MHLIEDPQDTFGDNELKYWLALSQCTTGYNLWNFYEKFNSLKPFWLASRDELITMGQAEKLGLDWLTMHLIDKLLKKRATVDPDLLLAALKETKATAYAMAHPFYPAMLRHCNDPPAVLYHIGGLSLSQLEPSIGVVGTRHPSMYGQKHAKAFAKDLASAGMTIVSGMAVGVDSLAHWGAIEAGGRTIAVVAGGPDHCYPSSNRPLYKKLTESEQGCVISEFFPGIKPDQWHFPARNRIIAGMTKGLLVIEAGEKSGSLITSSQAFDYGRSVFAIPNKIESPQSIGTHKLITETKAKLVTNVQTILTDLNIAGHSRAKESPRAIELFGREREVFDLIGDEPVHFDQLADTTGMNVGELSSTLTILELAGVVERLAGDAYIKA